MIAHGTVDGSTSAVVSTGTSTAMTTVGWSKTGYTMKTSIPSGSIATF